MSVAVGLVLATVEAPVLLLDLAHSLATVGKAESMAALAVQCLLFLDLVVALVALAGHPTMGIVDILLLAQDMAAAVVVALVDIPAMVAMAETIKASIAQHLERLGGMALVALVVAAVEVLRI